MTSRQALFFAFFSIFSLNSFANAAPATNEFKLMSAEEIALHKKKMASLPPEEQAIYRDKQYKMLIQKAQSAGYKLPLEAPWETKEKAKQRSVAVEKRRGELALALEEQRQVLQASKPAPAALQPLVTAQVAPSALDQGGQKQMQSYREIMKHRFEYHLNIMEQQRQAMNAQQAAHMKQAQKLSIRQKPTAVAKVTLPKAVEVKPQAPKAPAIVQNTAPAAPVAITRPMPTQAAMPMRRMPPMRPYPGYYPPPAPYRGGYMMPPPPAYPGYYQPPPRQ